MTDEFEQIFAQALTTDIFLVVSAAGFAALAVVAFYLSRPRTTKAEQSTWRTAPVRPQA